MKQLYETIIKILISRLEPIEGSWVIINQEAIDFAGQCDLIVENVNDKHGHRVNVKIISPREKIKRELND